ncbi:MAG: hypothetical protein QM779_04860 [Propionicimonas sp.]|uniref:hypothetical protein n=1 Tax=Propionicimonas sp. TaxID=1955623 RepID=UPI003D0C522C
MFDWFSHFFLDLLTKFVVWIYSVFGAGISSFWSKIDLPEPPAWVVAGVAGFVQLIGYVNSLSAWFPVQVLAAVTGWFTILVLIAIAIQVARIVASFASLGGGAT